MKFSFALLSLVLFVPPVFAQEGEAPAMPNPKTKEHEALATLAGTWRTNARMEAMPGVPGMEAATTWIGVENAELVCNGLWLKVSGDGKCDDKSCSGIWLLGYDPFAKRYKCLYASDMEECAGVLDAVRDEKTNTWTFTGKSPMGQFRSVFVLTDKDSSVETVTAVGDDGTEREVARIERTRLKGATAKESSAVKAAPAANVPVALTALLADCGTWDAEMKMMIPGAPPMESKCREVVMPICNGKWTWTNYTGTVMGAPFEGHALTGWDATKQRVVSFWIDSMSAPLMSTEGVYHADKKSFALEGSSFDEGGQSVPVTQVATRGNDGSRELRMTFGKGEDAHVMTIRYTRVGK